MSGVSLSSFVFHLLLLLLQNGVLHRKRSPGYKGESSGNGDGDSDRGDGDGGTFHDLIPFACAVGVFGDCFAAGASGTITSSNES